MPANNHTAIGFERGISGISDEIDQKLLNLIWIGAQDDIRSSWGLRRTAEKKRRSSRKRPACTSAVRFALSPI